MKKRKLKKKVKNCIFLLISICYGIGIFFSLSQLSFTHALFFQVDWHGRNETLLPASFENYKDVIQVEPEDNSFLFDISEDGQNDFSVKLNATSGYYTAKVIKDGNVTEEYDRKALEGYVSTAIIHPESVHVDMPEYTFEEALEAYTSENDLLLFATIGDNRAGFHEEEEELLRAMGFENTPMDTDEATTWIGLYQNQYAESYVQDEVNSHEWTVDGHREYVIAVPDESAPIAFIQIDEDELSYCGSGLNLVVYDTEKDEVVDSINWDFTKEDASFHRHTDIFSSAVETTLDDTFFQQIITKDQFMNQMEQIKWIGVSILILLAWIALVVVHVFFLMEKPLPTLMVILNEVWLGFVLIVGICLTIGYQYLRTQFDGVSISQLLYHMHTNLEGTNVSGFIDVIRPALLSIAMVLLVTIAMIVIRILLAKKNSHIGIQLFGFYVFDWTVLLIGLSIILQVGWQFGREFDVLTWLSSHQTNSNLFETYYVDPVEADIEAPAKKKNLIYIYLESMEITDADIAHGGGQIAENHIPELTQIALDNDCFNGSDQTLAGANVLAGTGWTIAGMTAQSAGIPLLADTGEVNGSFLPGAYSMGEVLAENGYHNTLMIGSDASFGNRLAYFEGHGNYEICDYAWAKETGKIPEDYAVWWGYEDEKLFNFAKEKAEELAEKEEPFNLTLLTADTHFPDGYLCENCPDEFAEQYSNVFACASRQISAFVSWVNEQPWGKDTVIVLAGDHVGMDARHNREIPEDYVRKTYVAVINSTKKEPDRIREYATIDLYPTTLSALGFTIAGDRLGLGTDLYAETPTLVEELSVEYLNHEIERTSSYYTTHILGQ